MNCSVIYVGVGCVDVRIINVVFGVLVFCWIFYNKFRIDYFFSFDIIVDLRYSWECKMRLKLYFVVIVYIWGDFVRL